MKSIKCSVCEQEKDESQFYRNSKRSTGRQSYCKDCHREYKRDWRTYAVSKMKTREADKRWRKNNPEIYEKNRARFKENNPNYFRDKNLEYRERKKSINPNYFRDKKRELRERKRRDEIENK